MPRSDEPHAGRDAPRAARLFSLRGRLLFLICLATLPALLFTFFAAHNERTATLARLDRDALHVARLTSREHAHQIQGAQELLRWLADRLHREGPSSSIVTDPAFLPALLAGYPQLANIGVLSADGRVLTSAYPQPSFPSMADNPAVVAALASRDVAIGRYLIGPIVHRPVLNLALAVRDADGRVTAVVFNALELEWLSEIARRDGLPAEFSLSIADRDGTVLAYGGATLPELGDAGLRIPDIDRLARSRHGALIDLGRVRRYFVVAPLGDYPDLYVAVGLPHERVLRASNAAFYRTLAGLILLTLFTIAAVFIATELSVLRALRALVHAVRRFGAGDLAARASAPRNYDELAALARAFNAMADSLAARHGEAVEAREQLRALASRLQVAREDEAARIARELHDEIGQLLTSLKIDLSRLPAHDGAALRAGIDDMNQRIAAALDFVRRISAELRPGVLDKLGLAAALQWQAREIEARTELAVQLEAEELTPPLSERTSVSLFRIAQEALTNVVRHAGASVVEITLADTDRGILLSVHDDGRGIPPDAVTASESLGLIGMRERALLIGGELSIHREPGGGTTVEVRVPRGSA